MAERWVDWVAGQPVLIAVLLLGYVVAGRVIGTLYRRVEQDAEARAALAREVITATTAATAAMAAQTAAVDRLTDALRGKR